MIWVVFRPQCDAVPNPNGEAWITQLRGYEVDGDIMPHGGIVLKEMRLSDPITWETVDQVTGYDPSGTALVKTHRIRHERKIIRTVQSKDMAAPLYVCEPIEHDAQILQSLRDGWWYQGFYKVEDIPLRSVMEASETAKKEATSEPVGARSQTAGGVPGSGPKAGADRK